ncbi:hypothetical protein YC2023_108266 [Brassica napus]
MQRPRRDIIKLLQSLYKIDQVFHKSKETRIERKVIRETIPDIEIRLASYTSKVPNQVAWDAKLLALDHSLLHKVLTKIKGTDYKEMNSYVVIAATASSTLAESIRSLQIQDVRLCPSKGVRLFSKEHPDLLDTSSF